MLQKFDDGCVEQQINSERVYHMPKANTINECRPGSLCPIARWVQQMHVLSALLFSMLTRTIGATLRTCGVYLEQLIMTVSAPLRGLQR
jgi:hypothetical protein